MPESIERLLHWLNNLDDLMTSRELLRDCTIRIGHYLQADFVLGYELIPETGGVPRLPSILHGELHSQRGQEVVSAEHVPLEWGFLRHFVRHSQLVYEPDASSWYESASDISPDLLGALLEYEQVCWFVFLPFLDQSSKLAILFAAGRQSPPPVIDTDILNICQALLGAQFGRRMLYDTSPRGIKKRMAIAHTLFGQAALAFASEMTLLQQAVQTALNGSLTADISHRLDHVRGSVYGVMRHLVINAAGDLLVDLREMTLAKALNTTAAALKRGITERINIDIPRIPPSIERQPFEMRELLYVLILELLGNAIEHGGPAPYINVDLYEEGNVIYLQVIDHGLGFDRSTIQLSEHGLGFWESYITQHLLGEFSIATRPGFGVTVSARIPVIG